MDIHQVFDLQVRKVRLGVLRLGGGHSQGNKHQLTRQRSYEEWLHCAPDAGFVGPFCPILRRHSISPIGRPATWHHHDFPDWKPRETAGTGYVLGWEPGANYT